MTITPSVAKTANAYLTEGKTAARAASLCQQQIAAIRPYTDRHSESVLRLLDVLAKWEASDPPKYARNRETLVTMTGGRS